jgi:hypothetical protein
MGAPYKITKRLQRLIVQRAIEGFSPMEILSELRENDVFVSVEAVRFHLRANARRIADGLETQWERAVVLQPDMGILEKRLEAYQDIMDSERRKDRPNNRVLLEAVAAAAHDVHTHEANLIRFKRYVVRQDEDEGKTERAARELEDMKAKFATYVRSVSEAEKRIDLLEAPEDDGVQGAG